VRIARLYYSVALPREGLRSVPHRRRGTRRVTTTWRRYDPLMACFSNILRPSFVRLCVPGLLLAIAIGVQGQTSPQYKYFRIGSTQDVETKTQAGFALMGGGTDLDEAFRWMCQRAGGGDFLVLRATGDDDYNPYIQPLCKLNSVATLILPSKEAANDPFVATTIAHAEAIFIAGGDQANYTRNWTGPVQAQINAAIKRGVPVGGTSAGLAVLGEWAYSAEGDKPDDPNLDGKLALENPLGPRITLTHGFLDIPVLKGIITDTHFAKRNRMGRLLVFLARIQSSKPKASAHGIGVEEKAAVLLEPDGKAIVIGQGSAYLVTAKPPFAALIPGKPLTAASFVVQKVVSGKSFSVTGWKSEATPYTLTVNAGRIQSTQELGAVY
jgi:cyanophycinase